MGGRLTTVLIVERGKEREWGRGTGGREAPRVGLPCPPANQLKEEEQGKWCIAGAVGGLVVKQVWSELNSRLGHGESIKPSLRQAGGRGWSGTLQPRVEIFTPGNLHTTAAG